MAGVVKNTFKFKGQKKVFTYKQVVKTPSKKARVFLQEKQNIKNSFVFNKKSLLRPKQQEDLHFLKVLKNKFSQGAGIFNEMRTGKTPLILTFLQEEIDIKKVLIIMPPNLILNWIKEIKKWAPRFEIINLNTTKAKRQQDYLQFSQSEKPIVGLIGTRILSKKEFQLKGDIMIVDEAHFLTKRSEQSKALKYRAKAFKYVYLLTATPTSRNSCEVFDLANIIRPNGQPLEVLFWKEYFCNSVPNFFAYLNKEYVGIKNEKEEEFNNWLKCNFTKKEYDKTGINVKEEVVYLQPTPFQEAMKNHINDYMEVYQDPIDNVLVKLTRLMQLATTPYFLGKKQLGPKIMWFKEFVKKNNGKKGIIVFSKYTSLLKKLAQQFPKSALLAGNVSNKEKNKNVEQFQNKEIDILFANIVSGSKGWTLDRGEVIIFLDISFAWEENDQAKARFWPTKQHLKNKPLKVYFLFLKNSIEKKVWKLVSKKVSKVEIIESFRN